MTDAHLLHELLGRPSDDPGCAACFDVMDEAAEALAAGEDISRRFAHVAAHVRDCAACREDLEGLRTYLQGSSERP